MFVFLKPAPLAGCISDPLSESYFNVVDLFNVFTGAWSTAQLSVARRFLAATSAGNVAIFAGGMTQGGKCLLSSTSSVTI